MYFNVLYRVGKRIGDKLYLIPDRYRYGWNDPRGGFGGIPLRQDDEKNYLVVDFDLCDPITDEVAQIMKSV